MLYNHLLMRPLYFLLGWCFFGLGAVDTVVPRLPTTPFMLLALWAFSKTSQRFHNWLYSHALFGPPLQRCHSHGVIPFNAKLLAVATMAVSFMYLPLLRQPKRLDKGIHRTGDAVRGRIHSQ